ncbi:hypothetical protein [Mycolicibacterium llatzerense]|uniref:hypothetical protein n=1 Tax=Mycolicibacterium llatzerense TaxID=280871 RepID=UPI0008DE6F79|nr:hypothetical protein [Mycolicibacterium llatzerense]
MTEILRCLTSSAELRNAADTAAPMVDLWLLDRDDTVVEVEVTIRAVRPEPDGRDRMICVLPCGHFASLILPAPSDAGAVVEIVEPDVVIDRLNTAGDADRIDETVAALELYLHWKEQVMAGPAPEAGNVPYSLHPVLRARGRDLRIALADHMAAGRRIDAIKLLRTDVAGLGLRESKTFIDALAHW